MKSRILSQTAKTLTLTAALGVTSVAFADGLADRRADAVPVEEYSLPQDQVKPVSTTEYHRHNGKLVEVPHALFHRRSASPLPYTGNDYGGRTAVENRKMFFGDN